MQWYVYLVTISATAVLSWFVSELLSQPLRAFFELRRKVLRQISIVESLSFPKPRELAVSSREIRDYDQALKDVREAQRAFSNLGFRLLAFGENEPVASNVLIAIGLNPVAAGSRLIELSMAYSRPHMDRADLCNQVGKALRSDHPAPRRPKNLMTGSAFRAPATADLLNT
jgi:hypothetical protein